MNDSRHEWRRHFTATAVVAVTFLVALAFVLVIGRPAESTTPVEPNPEPSVISQDTMLVQVSLGRVRLASLLTAVGGEPARATVLSLPPDLLVSEGPEYTPLLDANLSLNRSQSSIAVSDTLGVRVDSGWRLERKALAGLVDSVRGVTVTLAQQTEFLDDTGQVVAVLPMGEQLLEGPQASWYVMGTVAGEDPIAGQQQRFEEVFLAAVAKLPSSSQQVAAILTSLGALSDPLGGVAALSEYLLALQAQILTGTVTSLELPLRASSEFDPVTTRSETESGVAAEVGSFRVVDYPVAVPMLRGEFRWSPRIAGEDGSARVLVWNGTGVPAVTLAAQEALVDEGLIPLSAGAWERIDDATWINGRGFDPEGVSWSRLTAEALDIPVRATLGDVGSASPLPSPTSTVPPTMPPDDQRPLGDVDTVIGLDYQPCPADEPDCLAKETP